MSKIGVQRSTHFLNLIQNQNLLLFRTLKMNRTNLFALKIHLIDLNLQTFQYIRAGFTKLAFRSSPQKHYAPLFATQVAYTILPQTLNWVAIKAMIDALPRTLLCCGGFFHGTFITQTRLVAFCRSSQKGFAGSFFFFYIILVRALEVVYLNKFYGENKH